MRIRDNRLEGPLRWAAGLWRRGLSGFLGVAKANIGYRELLGGDYEDYEAEREAANFRRASVSALILLLLTSIGLLDIAAHPGSPGLPDLFSRRLKALYVIDIFLACAALALAVIFGTIFKKTGTPHKVFSRAVVAWIYAIGLAFTLNGQGFHDQLLNLLFALVFVAALFGLPPLFSLASHAVLCAAFCLLLGRFQRDPFLLDTNLDNAITATVLAFFASRVMFASELERFRREKAIERKNDEIRRQKCINKVLEIANERRLSPREVEIVKLLLQGKSNKEIAAESLVEVDTVKKQLSSIFRKCGVASRVELLLFFGAVENEGVLAS